LFEVTFVPVCHWSKRGPFEKNSRLWGGFVIKTPKGQRIFYSGDTAYCEIFDEIGERFGPFDLAVLPIGAYEPRHLLRYSHTDPEEAVVIHR
jgi:N-acyl-phosphatidylethanolamine-hydrolysing phospholipase D